VLPVTRPLVVFSHANGFPSGTYRKFFSFLEPHVEIRAIDMLGHDPRFPVNDNWGNLARELLAFIDTRCDRPVYGLGHSMGAMVTFMAAHRAPAKFRGIVMLDPPVINGWPAYAFQMVKWMGKADDVTPAGKSRNRRSVWPTREEAIADLGRKKLFANVDPECLRDYVYSVTEQRDDGFHLRYLVEQELAIFRTTPSNPYRYLRKLRVPGLVVTGETSDVARPEPVGRLHRWHGMAHRTAPGGHLFPLEHPQLAARLVREQIDNWERGHGA
jgi:pimeloyl-ACP methyl ester carboxylesterase